MWIKSVIHTLDIQDSVHDVVSISTINKCRMEPRLPFTLRILACELLKKFTLKSARPRTRHTSMAARLAAYLWSLRARTVLCTHQPQLHAITLGFVM